MSILVNDLIAQLTDDIPARNGTPSSNQYRRMVSEAAEDFSRRCGRIKAGMLNIVAQTATYDLPDDFVSLIRILQLAPRYGRTSRTLDVDPTPSMGYAEMYEGIINSASGIIPMDATFTEKWTVINKQITFYPTPVYTLTRVFYYKSGWIIQGDDDYTDEFIDMTGDESRIMMLEAKALCVGLQRNKMAADGWKYQIGDEQMDKTQQPTALKELQADLEAKYLAAVERYNGQYLAGL